MAAFVLSLLAGLLILVDGTIVAVVGSLLYSPVFIDWIGELEFVFGIVVLLLAVAIFTSPETHFGLGIAILVVSLLSIIGGGGFIIGLILGAIGGILGIVFVADTDVGGGRVLEAVSGETPTPPYTGSLSYPTRAGSLSQSGPPLPGPTIRACPQCGTQWPTVFTVCPKCGTTVNE